MSKDYREKLIALLSSELEERPELFMSAVEVDEMADKIIELNDQTSRDTVERKFREIDGVVGNRTMSNKTLRLNSAWMGQ